MAVHSRSVSRVRARIAYTGESRQQAALQLLGQAPGTPLVPDAALAEQTLLEYRVFSALAARIGRHEPARFGRAPYGIRSSSPSPDGLGLYLADEAVAALVEAVLPRRSPAGDVLGIEGLRYRLLSRHRVSLFQPKSAAAIVLHKASASWRRAVAELGTTEPDSTAFAWSDDAWTAVERTVADRRAGLLDEAVALRWSTALRRIGLARDAVVVDFTTALPPMVDLAGPYPDLLRPAPGRRRVGITVACVAQRGGSGRTTTVVNVGACLAERGKKVLIIDLAEFNGLLDWYARDRVAQARSAEARAAMDQLLATGDWSSVAEQLITLHDSDTGGHLAVLPGPVNCTQPQLHALLEAATAAADLVLLDAPPLGVGPSAGYAAQLADGVFTCVPVNTDIFGTWETSYSDRDEAALDRDELWSWLDDAYERYVDLAEVLRIQAQADELVAPTEMLDNALARVSYTNESLGDCLAALSGLDDLYELLDDGSPDEDELTDEDQAREAAAAARVEAWREANRTSFLEQVAATGRSLFGSIWDTEHLGWIEHNANVLDARAGSMDPDHSREHGDGGDGLAAVEHVSDPTEPDITLEFITHSAEEIATELEKVLHQWGIAPEDVGGRLLGLVPTRMEPRLVDAIRALPEQVTELLLSPGIPLNSAVHRSASFGQLFVITEPDNPASAAIVQLADAVYRRAVDDVAAQR
jgi:cellulose biosynthesis protein BcsQ